MSNFNTQQEEKNAFPTVYLGKSAIVSGKADLEDNVSIWHNAVVRGDSANIHIQQGSNIQDCSVVHTDEGFPVSIGRNCTVGHGAIVHGCTLEDEVLVGMGAIVMNGAHIGSHSIIGAGALVLEGMDIPAGSIVVGNPARIVKQVNEKQIADIIKNAEEYVEEAKAQLHPIRLSLDENGIAQLNW